MSAYLGRLSDKIGRIPLLRLNNLAAGLPIIALYLSDAQSAEIYFSAFVFSGFLTCGTFQIVAYVADCTLPENRTRDFGYLGAVSGLAFVGTPLITAFATDLSHQTLFLISLIVQIMCGIYIEVILPESLMRRLETEDEAVGNENISRFEFWHAAFKLVRENRLVAWLAVYILFTVLPEQGVVEIVLVYLTDVLGLTKDEGTRFLGLYLSLTGIGVFVSQSLLMWILTKQIGLGSIGLLVVSTLANIGHLLVYAYLSLTHSETMAFSNVALTTFMFVGLPASNSLLSGEVEATQQGLALGTLDSIRSLVGAFGPVLFSSMYSYFGRRHDFPQAPFLFGACFASLALLVLLGPLWRHKKSVDAGNEERLLGPAVMDIPQSIHIPLLEPEVV